MNSKEFSFLHAPKLPGSLLITTLAEYTAWAETLQELSVIKTCFGLAGRGHFFAYPNEPAPLPRLFQYELKEGRPLIAEPWMERSLDFSTQWEISKKSIVCLGETISECDARGKHRANRCGEEIPALEEHKAAATVILKKMAQLGYFGNVGIDAMLYRKNGKTLLHPIVEINARKTMGWVTLQLYHKHGRPLLLRLESGEPVLEFI